MPKWPVVLLGLAIAGAGFAWFGLTIVAVLATLFHAWFWLWGPVVAVIVALLVGLWQGKDVGPWIIVAGMALVAWGFIYGVAGHMFFVKHAYATQVIIVDEPTDFADRAPWVVADAYSSRDQGDLTGEKQLVKAVPDTSGPATTTRYTVLLRARGILGNVGYEAVQVMDLPVSGPIPSAAGTSCRFDDNEGLILNSPWPWRSMNRAIHNTHPGALWDSGDAYGYCDGDKAVVVVPLLRHDGFWVVTQVADGAMIYRDGNLTHMDADELVDAGILGPTFPQSLARTMRESLTASGSWGDWISGQSGFDTTSKDDKDANAGNATEFTLVQPGKDGSGGSLVYVTPLTPRGTSQSITALFVAPAQQDGTRPVVNQSPELGSTSTIETSIREASVSGDPEWATRWSAGMSVYEILPSADGGWSASIGQGQAVSYRATVSPSGVVSVVRTEPIPSTQEPGRPVVVGPGKPLSDMTEAELRDLIRRAIDELEARDK